MLLSNNANTITDNGFLFLNNKFNKFNSNKVSRVFLLIIQQDCKFNDFG